MVKCLKHSTIIGNNRDNQVAKLKDLKLLLRERDLDKSISEHFSITNYGKPDDPIRVIGAKTVLDQFNEINDEKLDIIEKLGNIEVEINENNELVITFKRNGDIEPIKCEGVKEYEVTKGFLQESFKMGSYYQYCLENGFKDLVLYNIKQLFEKNSSSQKQFRLIRKEKDWLWRGFTSTIYKNYDNHLALYISLLLLHQLATKKNKVYYMEKSFVSDSDLRISFFEEQKLRINKDISVKFGIYVSNNELGNEALSFRLQYKILKNENSLSALLEESIYRIVHTASVDNTIHKLTDCITVIENQQQMVIKMINSVKDFDVSNDSLYDLIHNRILNKIGSDSKEKILEAEKKRLINETMTLFEIFGKLKELVTDVDEEIHIQRVFHQVLMERQERSRN